MVTGRGAGSTRLLPIGVGAVVGLVTGVTGILVLPGGAVTVGGGLIGAVGGGVTAAALSDHGLRGDVANGVAADLLSSALFFLVVLVAYLATVAAEEGLAVIEAVYFSLFYVVFGSAVAFPVALVSVAIAGCAAGVTSVAKRAVLG